MSVKSTADLTTENNALIVTQTTPESITPASLGGTVLQDAIDSSFNRIDDDLQYRAINITKVQLAALIAGNTVKDKQWYKITDRSDGFPLHVQGLLTNEISPMGIQIDSGIPCLVIMDYAATYDGETLPFIGKFNTDRQLQLDNSIVITDGTEVDGGVLTSDANGEYTCKKAQSYQSGILNPAAVSTTSKMLGLAIPFTPGKSGITLISVSGELLSDDLSTDTNLSIVLGTGSAPANGAGFTGTTIQTLQRKSYSATDRVPLSMNVVATLTAGVTYWIDMAAFNNASGSVQLFNVSVSLLEQ